MIWLIGGTVNARELGFLLKQQGWEIVMTTATLWGGEMASVPGVKVLSGRLHISEMDQLIRDHAITAVVDASHPFAIEVSANAIEAARRAVIPYLRFERKTKPYPGISCFQSYDALVNSLKGTSGNILLTIGSKNIGAFLPLDVERLYVRILGVSASIRQCEEAGLKPSHIIAMSGVFSVAFNRALMDEFQIRYMVTKESGEEGGINEKIEAAQRLGVEVLMLMRPAMVYPEVFGEYDGVIERLKGESSFG
jgi:precorrin-6A/cobalt-precorrin-6A reductase